MPYIFILFSVHFPPHQTILSNRWIYPVHCIFFCYMLVGLRYRYRLFDSFFTFGGDGDNLSDRVSW